METAVVGAAVSFVGGVAVAMLGVIYRDRSRAIRFSPGPFDPKQIGAWTAGAVPAWFWQTEMEKRDKILNSILKAQQRSAKSQARTEKNISILAGKMAEHVDTSNRIIEALNGGRS